MDIFSKSAHFLLKTGFFSQKTVDFIPKSEKSGSSEFEFPILAARYYCSFIKHQEHGFQTNSGVD